MYEMNPTQRKAFEALNDREQRFAIKILSGASGPEAIAAGWPHTNERHLRAGTVRNRPHVHRFLTEMQCALIDDAIMSRNEAMERLTRIARTSITDVIDIKEINWGTDDNPDVQTMWQLRNNEEALETVSELKAGPNGPQIKLHDPLKAIKQMAEMNGWNANVGIDVNNGGTMLEGEVVDVTALSNEALHELVMLQYAGSTDQSE